MIIREPVKKMHLNGALTFHPCTLHYLSPEVLDSVCRWDRDLGSIFNKGLMRSLQSASSIDNIRSQKRVIKHATQFF